MSKRTIKSRPQDLMNAVTAVARDTSDPEMRWRLEGFGGTILSVRPLPPGSVGRPAERLIAAVAAPR
jgi:hypothetical protein